MIIKSTIRPKQQPAPKKPGLLIGVESPPEQLAIAAQKALSMSNPPSILLIGISGDTLESSQSEALDKALVQTGVKAAKLISKELAKSSNSPILKHSVDVFWLGVNVWQIYEKWQKPEKDIPSLMIDVSQAGLSVLTWGSALTGADETPEESMLGFLHDPEFKAQAGAVFTATSAAVKGQDSGLALLNQEITATEIGKVVDLASPILNAAIKGDPAFAGITFKPLPIIDYTPKPVKIKPKRDSE